MSICIFLNLFANCSPCRTHDGDEDDDDGDHSDDGGQGRVGAPVILGAHPRPRPLGGLSEGALVRGGVRGVRLGVVEEMCVL